MIAGRVHEQHEMGHNQLAGILESMSQAHQANDTTSTAVSRGSDADATTEPDFAGQTSTNPKDKWSTSSSSASSPPANQLFPTQQGALDPWMKGWNEMHK